MNSVRDSPAEDTGQFAFRAVVYDLGNVIARIVLPFDKKTLLIHLRFSGIAIGLDRFTRLAQYESMQRSIQFNLHVHR